MHHPDLATFLATAKTVLSKGPVAIIMAEDGTEVDTTLRHHLVAGFKSVILLARLPGGGGHTSRTVGVGPDGRGVGIVMAHVRIGGGTSQSATRRVRIGLRPVCIRLHDARQGCA